MSSYQEALDILNRLINYERSMPTAYSPETLNLDRIGQLLDRLAWPDRSFRSIHIAGTKGKGSTAAMIESILRAAGYRTGLYTSPHLHTFRERIRISGEIISKEDFVTAFEAVQSYAPEVNGLTWFEMVTAIAFQAFDQAQIDIGVIEVGLGGRFDATNVITPIVSVITSLSMDHMNLLGDTLEKIAFEKAGIIKPGIPIVSASQRFIAMRVIARVAKERSARLIAVDNQVTYKVIDASLDGQIFEFSSNDPKQPFPTITASIPLLGTHQIINAATAITAVRVAREQNLSIDDEAIQRGLSQVKWPGRLEILSRDPLLIVDGAHNADSAEKLVHALRNIFGDRSWTLIIGISADKDIPKILDALLSIATRVFVTRARSARATDVETLAAQVRQRGAEPLVANDVASALELALADHNPIIVTGSLFTVADARAIWFERLGIDVISD
jgi:dihydrofolate synthase/folylpolyglutamate synthase